MTSIYAASTQVAPIHATPALAADPFAPDALVPAALVPDALGQAGPVALPSGGRRGRFSYQGDVVSAALVPFPELAPAWSYRTSECGHGGVHRLSVLDPIDGGERKLTNWVVRVSPKTGDAWVRELATDGTAVGKDQKHPTLLLAKSAVEVVVAEELGLIALLARTATVGTDDGTVQGTDDGTVQGGNDGVQSGASA